MTSCRRPRVSRATACLALLSLGVLVAGVAYAATTTRIEPGKSIAGIKIGQSESAIVSALGKPSTRECSKRDAVKAADRYTSCLLTYKQRKLNVILLDNAVLQMSTTSSRMRTSKSIGAGSTRAALDRAYPACKDPDKSYCILGSTKKTGDRYTFFPVSKQKVERAVVGRWDRRFGCALGCG